MYISGEYYMLAGKSVLLCIAPDTFITAQGYKAKIHSNQLVHLPKYLADGGEPFALGHNAYAKPLPPGYWEEYVKKAREDHETARDTRTDS